MCTGAGRKRRFIWYPGCSARCARNSVYYALLSLSLSLSSPPPPGGSGVKPRLVFRARTPPMGIINPRGGGSSVHQATVADGIYYYYYDYYNIIGSSPPPCLNKPNLMIRAHVIQYAPEYSR